MIPITELESIERFNQAKAAVQRALAQDPSDTVTILLLGIEVALQWAGKTEGSTVERLIRGEPIRNFDNPNMPMFCQLLRNAAKKQEIA